MRDTYQLANSYDPEAGNEEDRSDYYNSATPNQPIQFLVPGRGQVDWKGDAPERAEVHAFPARREQILEDVRRTNGTKVAGVAELLRNPTPQNSFYDNLRPDLRYLMSDSWSGLTGQFTSALALLHLASLTQRVAILPSWNDEGHYGKNYAKMSQFFDMELFRETTGILFVELDDVKILDPEHTLTPEEEIGCYVASWFENALAYGHHNLKQQVYRVGRPGSSETDYSFESFALHDFGFDQRMNATKKLLGTPGMPDELPRNLREETKSSGMLCYTNIWDLRSASRGEGVGEMDQFLTGPLSGREPEWWQVGRYLDFVPAIWEIAMSCVRETLKLKPNQDLPPLLTVHLRRGDFLEWCGAGHDCTPTLDRYSPAVEKMLKVLPRGTKVLVTTDETKDQEFLHGIDKLGWFRIDHAALETRPKLVEKFGEFDRWADAAVDQAILSLGKGMVGTQGSQVSQISALRVETYQKGPPSILIPRPK